MRIENLNRTIFLPLKGSHFIFIFILFFSSCGIKQSATLPQITNNKVVKEYGRLLPRHVDSLKSIYGNNKIFLEEFIEPTLIALSYYPELKDTHIEFKFSEEATTMAARPIPLLLFFKRKYIILVNKNRNFKGILLRNVPFNAQIGIIGHELAHIADYNNRNIWGILGILFRYSDSKRKPLFEKEIDQATVLRGLGWQLYDWAMYSMYTNKYASEDYKEFKRKTYMTPPEIINLINFLSMY